jgi:hypothetical protein
MSDENDKIRANWGFSSGYPLPDRSDARFTPDTNMALPVRIDEKRRAIMYPQHGNKCGFYLTESPISMIEVKREDGIIYDEVENNAPIGNLEYSVRKYAPNLGFLWFSNNENLEHEFDVSYQGMGMTTHVQNLAPPVGSTYTQYPPDRNGLAPLAPEEMWAGTKWKRLDYDSATFRSEGLNPPRRGDFAISNTNGASPFGSGLQSTCMPSIRGMMDFFIEGNTARGMRCMSASMGSGALYTTTLQTGSQNPAGVYPSSSTGTMVNVLHFDAMRSNGLYGHRSFFDVVDNRVKEDVMPENYTVRIWLRLA